MFKVINANPVVTDIFFKRTDFCLHTKISKVKYPVQPHDLFKLTTKNKNPSPKTQPEPKTPSTEAPIAEDLNNDWTAEPKSAAVVQQMSAPVNVNRIAASNVMNSRSEHRSQLAPGMSTQQFKPFKENKSSPRLWQKPHVEKGTPFANTICFTCKRLPDVLQDPITKKIQKYIEQKSVNRTSVDSFECGNAEMRLEKARKTNPDISYDPNNLAFDDTYIWRYQSTFWAFTVDDLINDGILSQDEAKCIKSLSCGVINHENLQTATPIIAKF